MDASIPHWVPSQIAEQRRSQQRCFTTHQAPRAGSDSCQTYVQQRVFRLCSPALFFPGEVENDSSRGTLPQELVFRFFLLQPSYLHLGDGCCRYRMAPVSCLPCILTFTGNNRNHPAARSDSKSCPNHPAAAATHLPPPLSYPTSLHHPCFGGLAQESLIAMGMRGAHSSTLGGFSV